MSAAAGQAGEEAAAVARTVNDWTAGSYLHLVGGTGPSYPSLTVEADSGRTRGARPAHATAASWSCTQARMAAARPGSPGQEDVPDAPVKDWPIEHATLSCGAPLR